MKTAKTEKELIKVAGDLIRQGYEIAAMSRYTVTMTKSGAEPIYIARI